MGQVFFLNYISSVVPKDKTVFAALATETHSEGPVSGEQNDSCLFVSVFQEPAETE